MSKKEEAVKLLREFAFFRGDGMRGVIRMNIMQAKAIELLAKIDKVKP